MKKYIGKIVLCLALVCALFVGFLYFNNDIGIRQSKIESDIRTSQKIQGDWSVEGIVSDTMAAFISYPQDKSDHSYSVYVNRTGLSFGYFFRGGGNSIEVGNYISEFTIDGYNERAFISMNTQKVERLEIDNGKYIQVIKIDNEKPFALVLPVNSGNIIFYDTEGNIVEWVNNPL